MNLISQNSIMGLLIVTKHALGSSLEPLLNRIIAISSSVLYAIVYMFLTGIIINNPEIEISTEKHIPSFWLVPAGNYLEFPWIVGYIDKHTILSMSFPVMSIIIIISTLVGLNSALLTKMIRTQRRNCSSKLGITSSGIVPGFLTLHVCCGGGLIIAILGIDLVSALFPYSSALNTVSIAVLLFTLFWLSKHVSRILQVDRDSN